MKKLDKREIISRVPACKSCIYCKYWLFGNIYLCYKHNVEEIITDYLNGYTYKNTSIKTVGCELSRGDYYEERELNCGLEAKYFKRK